MCPAMRGFKTFIDVIATKCSRTARMVSICMECYTLLKVIEFWFKPYINSPSHLKINTHIKLVDRLEASARN